MKKTYIYNLSKSIQHVEIGDPIGRNLTITPGNHAWFRRIPNQRLLISSRSGLSATKRSMFLLPSEDNVLITDSGLGSNLTTKLGGVENRATYPISVSPGGNDGTIVPPGAIRSFLFTRGEVWNIHSTRDGVVGKFRVESPDDTIVFDGISSYILR